MTPPARAAAAIAVLDRVLSGEPAEAALLRWSRGARYAGSGDRAAVRDLVFDALRRRPSLAALGGADSGRGLILGALRAEGADPDAVFGAGGHAPEALTAEERAGGRAPDATEALNLPPWLIPPLRETLGDALPEVAAAMSQRAPVWLRANALKASPGQAIAALAEDGIAVEPAPDLPAALRVSAGTRGIKASRAYGEGVVELQDVAPQRAVAMLGSLGGASVLDFCAGGGGKTLALAAQGAGRLVAHDADPRRMADLPARAARAGARVTIAAPEGRFDLVVADVPCSGTGTLARSPDARWRLRPEDVARLEGVQAAILAQAAAHVAPGGRLALMTCSLLRAENDAQADALARWPGWDEEARRLWTPRDGGDGFFCAVVRRR